VRSNLENRYRRLLRVLPAWYRAEREEEMVGLFLADRTDDLDLEHGWPGWGETGATLTLAVRTRFAASGAPTRAVATGDVVRLVAVLGVLVLSAYAAQGLLSSLLPVAAPDGGGLAPVSPVAVALDAVPLVGALALVAGHRGAAKAVFAALSVVAGARLGQAVGPEVALRVLWHVPLWLTTLALLAGFHRDAPAPVRTGWRWAPAAVAGGAVAATLVITPFGPYAALVPAATVVTGLVHLARRGSAVGSLALAVWIAALLPVELLSPAYSDTGRVLAVSMIVVGAALLAVGLRKFRRPSLTITP
jgi:hypothetical protein